jgi:hypothetical protein
MDFLDMDSIQKWFATKRAHSMQAPAAREAHLHAIHLVMLSLGWKVGRRVRDDGVEKIDETSPTGRGLNIVGHN